MPTARRYVLLRHECPADYRDGPHWDLMIEAGGALRTWSLLELPAVWRDRVESLPDGRGSESCNRAATVRERSESIPATELPPHRLAYLEYEGEVSGGRGSVRRVAEGTLTLREEAARLVIVDALTGALSGSWQLGKQAEGWLLTVDNVHDPVADAPG